MRISAAGEQAALPRAVGPSERLLGGRYQIRRRLGEGGMGVVYEAFDDATKSAVALKTLTRVDAAGIYRLKNEFRSLVDVSHPNLVQLYELHADGERWFFTMGLIDGPTFLEHVREDAAVAFEETVSANSEPDAETVRAGVAASGGRHGAIRERTLREALAQLAAGVAAIHAAGKLHRDLKPQNVLVTSAGRVVILDFGLVSDAEGAAISQTVAEERIAGTPAYMAPEQARGERATAASDWYAVGVILFEALTGVLPFQGSMLEVLGRKQSMDPPAPADLAPGVPEDLNRLCLDLLQRNPQHRPDGAAVLERVGPDARISHANRGGPRTAAAESAQPGANAPFVGREAELSELRACLQGADAGSPIVTLVVGPSGIGKTSLVERFLETLAGLSDLVVVQGRCYEREAVPYKAFDGVIDALTRYLRRLPAVEAAKLLPRNVHALARLFPVLDRVEVIAGARQRAALPENVQELRRLGIGALREMFARIADSHRLVVSIDDIQWGDLDSAYLLGELLAAPDAPPLLVVGTARSDETERSAFLRELKDPARGLRGVEVRTIAVEPLTEADVSRLIARIGANPLPLDAARIHAESQGNPFLVDELVRYAGVEGRTTSAIDLHAALRTRVERLPGPARRLLEAIAVAAQPLERSIAAAAAGMDLAAAREAFETLRGAGFARSVARSGRGGAHDRLVTTYHDRVRDSVTRNMADEERRTQHLRVAEAFESGGASDPDALSHHFLEARDFARACRYALEAARRANDNLAFERAAMLYRIAIDHGEHDAAQRLKLLLQLAEALVMAARDGDTVAIYSEAAELATHAGQYAVRQDCRRRAAEQMMLSGDVERGIQLLSGVFADVGEKFPATSRRALLELLWDELRLRVRGLKWAARDESELTPHQVAVPDAYYLATYGLSFVQPTYSAHFASRGLLLALRAGEPRRVALHLAGHGIWQAMPGARRFDRVGRFFELAWQAAAMQQNPRPGIQIRAFEGLASCYAGRWSEGLERFRESADAFDKLPVMFVGDHFIRSAFRFWRLQTLSILGRLAELGSECDRMLHDAIRRNDRYFEATLKRAFGWGSYLRQDEPAEALKVLEAVKWSPSITGFNVQHGYERYARAEIGLYIADDRQLLPTYRPWLVSFERSPLRRMEFARCGLMNSRAKLAVSDAELGAERARSLREAARWSRQLLRADPAYARAWGSIVAAAVAWQRGDVPHSVVRLRAAITLCDEVQMSGSGAGARWRLGQLLGGDEGAALLADAYRWAEREGVKNPDRFLRMYAPGFDRRPATPRLLPAAKAG